MIPVPCWRQGLLVTGHTDMRKGFSRFVVDGAGGAKRDPMCGHLFVVRVPRSPTTDILHTFLAFDDCLSLAPAVREEGAGLAVQAWQSLTCISRMSVQICVANCRIGCSIKVIAPPWLWGCPRSASSASTSWQRRWHHSTRLAHEGAKSRPSRKKEKDDAKQATSKSRPTRSAVGAPKSSGSGGQERQSRLVEALADLLLEALEANRMTKTGGIDEHEDHA